MEENLQLCAILRSGVDYTRTNVPVV